MVKKNRNDGMHMLTALSASQMTPQADTREAVRGRFHEFTLDEAIAIAKRNDPGEKVPSVSRTLIAALATADAECERLREAFALKDAAFKLARSAAEDYRAAAQADEARSAEMERDAARLDALEAEIASGGPIVLHNGEGTGGIHRGLGLSNTNRSLRQAIDDLCALKDHP